LITGRFAFLATNLLVGIAYSLTLVRLGRVVGADVGSNLADEMFVDALNRYLGIIRDNDFDFVRYRKEDRV